MPEPTLSPTLPRCRFCDSGLSFTLVDLGMSPLCESYVSRERLNQVEHFYPLHVYVCDKCFLAQLEEYVPVQEIFSDYAYFSSYSVTWIEHARKFVEQVVARFDLTPESQVVELGSNDGYLLQHFLPRKIPVLGIEPAANVAKTAEARGIPSRVAFFGSALAGTLRREGIGADLIIGNNVLAQVPSLNDFVQGIKVLLKPDGVMSLEFPHLLELIRQNQFDTIYHEHFSYFSFKAAEEIFARHEIVLFDVETLPTHGGSLRIFGRHAEDATKSVTPRVEALRRAEREAGLDRLETYNSFNERVMETKRRLLEFLIRARREGKKVVGYGAPGKGNTLLNYCGIRTDFLDYTVDRNPHKQGKFLPGTRIPILDPQTIYETKPDYILVLPWNLKDEIMEQLSDARKWGARFIVPIPEVRVY